MSKIKAELLVFVDKEDADWDGNDLAEYHGVIFLDTPRIGDMIWLDCIEPDQTSVNKGQTFWGAHAKVNKITWEPTQNDKTETALTISATVEGWDAKELGDRWKQATSKQEKTPAPDKPRDGDACPECSGCVLRTETDDGTVLQCDHCGTVFE